MLVSTGQQYWSDKTWLAAGSSICLTNTGKQNVLYWSDKYWLAPGSGFGLTNTGKQQVAVLV